MKKLYIGLIVLALAGLLFAQPITVTLRRFIDMTDTPSTYSSQAGKLVTVNSGETALEFTSIAGSHSHDAETLQFDSVNSDGGGFSFTTSGAVTFNQSITTAGLTVTGDSIYLETSKTPASAGDTGTAGAIAWDTGYIYVCTSTNSWKRAALSAWSVVEQVIFAGEDVIYAGESVVYP